MHLPEDHLLGRVDKSSDLSLNPSSANSHECCLTCYRPSLGLYLLFPKVEVFVKQTSSKHYDSWLSVNNMEKGLLGTWLSRWK